MWKQTWKWIRARNDCSPNHSTSGESMRDDREFGEWKMAISLEPTSYNITRTPPKPEFSISALNDDKLLSHRNNFGSPALCIFSELWHFHTAYIVSNKINSHTHIGEQSLQSVSVWNTVLFALPKFRRFRWDVQFLCCSRISNIYIQLN